MVVLYIFLLILGFALLVKGADFFVDSASVLAKKMRIPSIVIGLTIVSIGTSLPELAVSVSAAIGGSNDIALGNIIGSNLFNLLAVVGLSALFSPLLIKKDVLQKDYPFSIAVIVLLLLLVFDGGFGGTLGTMDGIILLLLLGIYLYSLILGTLKSRKETKREIEPVVMCNLAPFRYSSRFASPRYGADRGRNIFFNLFVLVIGLAAIVLGGDLVVNNAVELASMMGISENLIALTIVAIGTSLPELVTSVVAAKKGETDIAIGNVVGSNIFNILLILGISSAIHPITVNGAAIIDLIILLGVTVLFFVPMALKKGAGRVTGALMIAAYIAYTAYIILRNFGIA